MKWSFLLFSSLICLQAFAQYPATGNKARLGWQTTGDGLVYRGAIGDTTTLDPSGINNAWMLLDTASGNLYAYRTKAWRLVSGGGGGGLTMPFDSVTFNVNETDASIRELKYSEEKGYLQYGGQDSVQIPILPGIWYVRNDTSVTIPKGTVLRATGTLGASGRIKVKHMIANGSIDAMYILGIAMHDIAVGADGYAMSQGKIRKINTQAYSEGAVLYADVDTLGGLTQTEPGNGFLKLPIAFVVHSASNGVLAVRVTSGAYMRDLHDVEITSPDSSASLYYNMAQGIWRDTGAAVLVADTAAMLTNYINVADTATMLSSYISNADTSVFARDFQISGTTNRLAMFTGANTVGNSQLFDDGTNISLGSTNALSNGANSRWLTLYGSTGYSGGIVYSVADTALAYQYLNADASGKHLRHFASSGYGQTFFTNGVSTPRMTISSDGNVGIGTASPGSYLLNLRDSIGFLGNGMYFSSTNGGTANPGGNIIGTKRGSWGTRIDFVARDAAGATTETVMSIDGEGGGGGNVGINTVSPSRPLHVAGATAIRIPSGATADRGTSANGDIRYNTDNANFEWYNSGTGGWREPVNAARSPAAGLANRFAKFDANGLLDTSAVLVQANGRIGIWNNSPAAGDSALTVTGGIRATTGVRATLLNVNTSGTQVLSINNYSGNTNTSPNNVFIGNGGQSATGSSLEGRNNIGIGTGALFSLTTGYFNLAIGSNALSTRATNVLSNIAIGYQAMQSQGNTQNSDNTAIGTNALRYNKGGNYNVALGSNALTQNTTSVNNDTAGVSGGSNNFGLGFQACHWNGTGLQNVGIGSSANYANRNGSYNIAIGGQALAGGTSVADTAAKSNNVAIGANSLEFLKGNSAGNSDENVAIGYYAGRSYGSGAGTDFTAGKTSVYIGAYTRANANTNENEVVIGYSAIGNGSNTTTIGNSSTTATIFQYGETRLGMAVDSGAYRLQVNGDTKLIGNLARKKPVTIAAATYTVLSDDSWLICNHVAQITITLPTAASSIGRELMIKYVAGGGATVISNATNVSPIVGGALTNIILPATAGSWVTLVCDGVNWIIMQKG